MEHLEFIFENIELPKSEMLIAQLNELNFTGFEESENVLKAYIPHQDFSENLFNKIIEIVDVKYSYSVVKQINWNEIWEAGFEPVSLFHPEEKSLFAYIRASFHPAETSALHNLIITPKMSFGTGHHATTFQMMEQMSLLDFSNKIVIDFGTGTGLLSILAEKMGASSIIAIDNDDWSINNAKENIVANQCKNIDIIKADTCIKTDMKADIILANINLNVILENLDSLKICSKTSTIVLFSGILKQDEKKLTDSLLEKQFNIIQIKNKENWLIVSATV